MYGVTYRSLANRNLHRNPGQTKAGDSNWIITSAFVFSGCIFLFIIFVLFYLFKKKLEKKKRRRRRRNNRAGKIFFFEIHFALSVIVMIRYDTQFLQ